MEKYLIDNNAISNFLSLNLSESGEKFMVTVIDQIPNISIITQIEALSWVNKDKSKELIIKDFVLNSIILPIDQDIVNTCVKIKRGRKIKMPDSIIAATAISKNLTLITSDKDFNKIKSLKLIDPLEF